ncbi:MAG: chloride channel protein [Actinomycetota bacterium]
MTDSPDSRAVVRLMSLSAALGVLVAVGFHLFERSYQWLQHWLWVTVPGQRPTVAYTLALATAGGLLVGLALRFVPGHGGAHPADGHGLLGAAPDAAPPKVAAIVGSLLVGWIGLVAGASLGPEGAIFPVAIGLSFLVASWGGLTAQMRQLLMGAGVGSLLASMLGNPLAGILPLLEMVPASSPLVTTMLVLPSLVASSTAVLTLHVLHAHPVASLPIDYPHFHVMHLVWAVLIGMVAGAAGLLVDRSMRLLRRFTRLLDARGVVLTGAVGGLVLGVLYAIGGVNVRFSGMPELLHLVADSHHVSRAVWALVVKVAATAWCLAVGYRGGKIFPVVFVGGAVGLALHLMLTQIPLPVAVGVGLSAAMATALAAPATAAMIAAALVGPALLPLALLGIVVAHTVHLLADQVRAASTN